MLARRCDRCNEYFMPDMTYHDSKNVFKRIDIVTCKKAEPLLMIFITIVKIYVMIVITNWQNL